MHAHRVINSTRKYKKQQRIIALPPVLLVLITKVVISFAISVKCSQAGVEVVIAVTWSKRCKIIEKPSFFFAPREKCSLWLVRELLSWPHGGNVTLLLQKKRDFGHMAET